MKVLIALTDQSFVATKSMGIFNVSLGLARGLMQVEGISELHILGNNECANDFGDLPAHVHLHLADKPVPRRFARVWWDQFGVSAAIRRISPDWAILPKGFPPYFPCLGKTKLACYVHDFIWEHYRDLKGDQHETPFPPHQLLYFTRLGLRALDVSALVLTSTRFNASRFAAYRPQARTAVVGIGFDGEQKQRAARDGGDVLFYVSPFPHKLTRLGVERLKAWLAQREDAASIRIHLIGSGPHDLALPSEQWVKHGRLSQAELAELMCSGCRAACYFSAYEGFGMPPVECLRIGLPCVASDLPPIRENIPAPYLFDNDDEQSFIHCMNQAYDSEQLPPAPAYPRWQEVAQRAVAAMMSIN